MKRAARGKRDYRRRGDSLLIQRQICIAIGFPKAMNENSGHPVTFLCPSTFVRRGVMNDKFGGGGPITICMVNYFDAACVRRAPTRSNVNKNGNVSRRGEWRRSRVHVGDTTETPSDRCIISGIKSNKQLGRAMRLTKRFLAWPAGLRLPQYRTQSHYLFTPGTTCFLRASLLVTGCFPADR